MRVLIAEDEPISRHLLETTLFDWGYEVVVTQDGNQAWDMLRGDDAPKLAILDWQMPGLDGLEVCRRDRALLRTQPTYIVLLTGRGGKDNVVAGLRGGANDYLVKPFDLEELAARLHVGVQIVQLQQTLAQRVRELEESLAQVRRLQGLIPICAWCKKVRNDQNYWQQVEDYVGQHSDARFSHGICPECFKEQTAANGGAARADRVETEK
jgi:DNA-binding response OmpR family regulator